MPAGSTVDRVLAAAGASGLLGRGDPLVVLVSGGRDSVCLLDVAVTVCGPERLLALHLDYGLRGAESAGDAEHVRDLCAALGVELELRRAPAPPGAGNRQAWARDLRYAAAVELAHGRAARIATGHTASDQAETILYRLAASPGRRALLGMAAADGLLIRPLLGVSRAQTGAYCRARGLAWREDSSNAGDRYARGRARHGLAAALAELHPAAEQNIVRSAALLRDEAAVLDAVVETALAGRGRIALARLAALPVALARLVVVRLAEDAAGQLVPSVGGRLEELLALAPRGGSAQVDIGGGARAVVEYGVLRFVAAAAPAPPPGYEVALAVPGSASFGDWLVEARIGERATTLDAAGTRAPAGADPGALGQADQTVRAEGALGQADPTVRAEGALGQGDPTVRAEGALGQADPTVRAEGALGQGATTGRSEGTHGLLDADAVAPEGLRVRGWRAGDRIAPLGLGGTKSLADLFCDRRVPRAERRQLPLVTSGGDVAWVPGVATGERFRVVVATRRTVVLSARRERE